MWDNVVSTQATHIHPGNSVYGFLWTFSGWTGVWVSMIDWGYQALQTHSCRQSWWNLCQHPISSHHPARTWAAAFFWVSAACLQPGAPTEGSNALSSKQRQILAEHTGDLIQLSLCWKSALIWEEWGLSHLAICNYNIMACWQSALPLKMLSWSLYRRDNFQKEAHPSSLKHPYQDSFSFLNLKGQLSFKTCFYKEGKVG